MRASRTLKQRDSAGLGGTDSTHLSPARAHLSLNRAISRFGLAGTSKPVRSCSPRLGRFDSGAAPLGRISSASSLPGISETRADRYIGSARAFGSSLRPLTPLGVEIRETADVRTLRPGDH